MSMLLCRKSDQQSDQSFSISSFSFLKLSFHTPLNDSSFTLPFSEQKYFELASSLLLGEGIGIKIQVYVQISPRIQEILQW